MKVRTLSSLGVSLGVPAEASDRLLNINNPTTRNKYGFPGDLPEYKAYFGGFEVNFLPELKALHEAGYNILTYDLRKCGRSGKGNGGISGLGLLKCRDVVGSVRHAKNHPVMGRMRTRLFSRCMGGNSTIIAMAKWPEEFERIEALSILNVVSGPTFIERGAENLGLNPKKAAERTITSDSTPSGWLYGSTNICRRTARCLPPKMPG